MKNKIQNGNVLSFPAPYDRLSGEGVQIGAAIFGVCVATALSGEDVNIELEGVFNLLKVTADVVTAGDQLYWDDAAKKITTTSTANILIGVAAAAADGSTTTVDVLVTP